jgi:F-type H+-transporting ATPase subunit beta
MTATAYEAPSAPAAGGAGRVSRVIGPVVDIEFPADSMPEIYNALQVDVTIGDTTRTLTMEVAQHLGDNLVRAISMQPTDGMVRGTPVRDTGEAISVPVGDITKGKVFNAIGDVLNLKEGERFEVTERWPIHRKAPGLRPARVQDRDVRDRHQGHRPADPYVLGGKIGLFGGAASARPC